MSVPEVLIRDAVVTALASVTGLSAEKVQIGRPTSVPPSPPCVWVAIRNCVDAFGPDLASYETTLTLDLYIFAAATSPMPEDKENASVNLGFAVRQAIRTMADPAGVESLTAPLVGLGITPEVAQSYNGPSLVVMESVHKFISTEA